MVASSGATKTWVAPRREMPSLKRARDRTGSVVRIVGGRIPAPDGKYLHVRISQPATSHRKSARRDYAPALGGTARVVCPGRAGRVSLRRDSTDAPDRSRGNPQVLRRGGADAAAAPGPQHHRARDQRPGG